MQICTDGLVVKKKEKIILRLQLASYWVKWTATERCIPSKKKKNYLRNHQGQNAQNVDIIMSTVLQKKEVKT